MSGGYIKPCGCDEDESCDVCHPPKMDIRRLYENRNDAKEIERLRGDLDAAKSTLRHDEERIRNMEKRMREMHHDLMRVVGERDEAREAHRQHYLYMRSWNPDAARLMAKKHPWLEEALK